LNLLVVAVWAVSLARTHAELDAWWRDNLAWIRRPKAEAPSEYDQLVDAGRARRASIGATAAAGPISPRPLHG
jgi:hypothetical protein